MDRPPKAWLIPSLIEHESCISLKHQKCWNPRQQLKTHREEGAGLGQLTRAYYPDGKLRFDKLAELRQRYPSEMRELQWSNIYQRPDLQTRAIVLMLRQDFSYFKHLEAQLAFVDQAYNGGRQGVDKDRRMCQITQGCNPQLWFNNVEKTCTKSKAILYANRSACDINRHHVKDVLLVRANKYQKQFY